MEEKLSVRGRLTTKLAPETRESKAGKSFTQTIFAIETDGKYPKAIAFNDFGAADVDKCNIGDEIIVSFEPESREYNGKYYTNLKAYKIEVVTYAAKIESVKVTATTSSPSGDAFEGDRKVEAKDVDDSDLPF